MKYAAYFHIFKSFRTFFHKVKLISKSLVLYLQWLLILISIDYASTCISIKLKSLASLSRPFKKVKDVKARIGGMLQSRVNPNKEKIPLQ